jgi:hypothetical protein
LPELFRDVTYLRLGVSLIHYRPTGNARPRMNRWHLVLYLTATVAVITVITSIVVVRASSGLGDEICEPGRLCGGPPPQPALSNSAAWQSLGLGYRFEYNAARLEVVSEGMTGVELELRGEHAGRVSVTAARAGTLTPEALLDKELSRIRKTVLGLTRDSTDATQIFGPMLGYIDGVGGSYRGTSDTPQGPSRPVTVAAVAATDRNLVAVLTFVLEGVDNPAVIRSYRSAIDDIVKTFRWGPIPP